MRIVKYIWLFLLLPFGIAAQNISILTLDEANAMAAKHYPLLRQKALTQKSSALALDNLQKNYLPQVSISAQATYQSAVTEVPIKTPAFQFEPLSKDQYRALLDVNQLIYDGGSISEQRKVQLWNDKIEDQKIEVELQKLRERINQVYFNALFAEEQITLTRLIDKDLDAGISRVDAQVKNGTAYRSALSLLKAEKLKNNQRATEWQATRVGLIEVLSEFIGSSLAESVKLEWPNANNIMLTDTINRSELSLLNFQDSLLQQKDRLIDVRNRPKFSAFLQGGYGKPGLNMLLNEFDFFYVTGIRANWQLSSLYTSKKDRQILEVNRQVLEVQRDNFLLQTRAQQIQQQAEIRKWASLLKTDEEIIVLKTEVKDAAKAQLDNGVITSSDYIREVNAEDQARLNKVFHQLQWIQSIINYQTISGK
jgi:outer membrane protein TolC